MNPMFGVGDLVMYYPSGRVPILISSQWFMGVVTQITSDSLGSYLYSCSWFKVAAASDGSVKITPHSMSSMARFESKNLRSLLRASEIDSLVNSL